MRPGFREVSGFLVTEIDGARLELARLEQTQVQLVDIRRPVRRSAANHDWMDDQRELDDQARADERRGQRRAADIKIAGELVTQAGQLVARLPAHKPAVVVDGLELAREHDLGRFAPDGGELDLDRQRSRVVASGWPVPG